MKKVLVIGAGELGSRHLQGICQAQDSIHVSILEPNEDSIQRARSRIEESRTDRIQFSFYKKMSELGSEFDIVIIATNSDVRFQVIQNFVSERTAKFFVLEKLLTNNLKDLESYRILSEAKNLKAWVNCPRRIYPFYREIREKFGRSFQKIRVEGGQWGLTSNSIHFLDLISFLQDSPLASAQVAKMNWFPSRRPGFYEATGEVHGHLKDGTYFEIVSNEKPLPIHIQTFNEQTSLQIQEGFGRYIVSRQQDLEQKPARSLYQSELTGLVVDDLMMNGQCGLVPLSESLEQHEIFLNACLEDWNQKNKTNSSICPIT